MLLTPWFTAIRKRIARAVTGRWQRPKIRRRDRLHEIQMLEERLLLSAVSWDGGANNLLWNSAANWSTDALPGSTDDVTIDAAGTVTVTSTEIVMVKSLTSADQISITSGSLSVLETATLNAGLTESGGVFYSGTNFSNASTISVGNGSSLIAGGLSGGVSIWHGEGNANDGFGNNTGTLTNGATTTTSGQLGSAFELDGVDDFVNVPSSSTLDPTAEATLQAWVYLDVLPSTAGHVMTVVAKSGNATDLDLQVETDNKVHFYVATGAPNKVISTTMLQAGQWYHLAATYKANDRVEMYVNGELEATTMIPGVIRGTNSNPLTIGASAQWAGRYFDGRIDEPALYSRALSAAEINSVMNGHSYTQTAGSTSVSGTLTVGATNIQAGSATLGSITSANVVSLYKAEGTANDSADSNHGTLVNGATTTTSGKIGSAFSLDGSNDYVSIPDSVSLRPTSLTAAAWINFSSPAGSNHVLSKTQGTSVYDSYVVWFGDGQLHGAISQSDGVFTAVDYTFSPAVGTWYHVALAFDDAGDSLKLFVDGVERASATTSLAIGYDNHPLTIGTGFDNESPVGFFPGRIDEVTILSRAMSVSEVAALAGASFTAIAGSTLTIPTGKIVGPSQRHVERHAERHWNRCRKPNERGDGFAGQLAGHHHGQWQLHTVRGGRSQHRDRRHDGRDTVRPA